MAEEVFDKPAKKEFNKKGSGRQRDKKPFDKRQKGQGKRPKSSPLDEAMSYLEKADMMLESENKGNGKKPPRKGQKKRPDKAHKGKNPNNNQPKKYDKSKRNLFDAEDYKEIKIKRSFWQKIKSIFGG